MYRNIKEGSTGLAKHNGHPLKKIQCSRRGKFAVDCYTSKKDYEKECAINFCHPV